MLSNHSFNALLKTLEEPPPHVKFLLATTDPQKLPVTVLSRCLQFNLKRFTVAQIQAQLEKICTAESIRVRRGGLEGDRARRGRQHARRAELARPEHRVRRRQGRRPRRSRRCSAASTAATCCGCSPRWRSKTAPRCSPKSRSSTRARPTTAPCSTSCSRRCSASPCCSSSAGAPTTRSSRRVAPFVEQFSAEDAQLYYQIALHGRRDLPVCREPRMGFEMTLLRMLAFRPAAEEGAPPAARPARAVAATARSQRAGARARPPRRGTRRKPRAGARARRPRRSAEGAAGRRARRAGMGRASCRHSTCAGRRGSSPTVAILQSNAGGSWQLVVPADKEHLNTQQLRARLEAALREHIGRDLRLAITVGSAVAPDARRSCGARTRARACAKRARRSRRDPNVKAVAGAFDATLEADSIRSSK